MPKSCAKSIPNLNSVLYAGVDPAFSSMRVKFCFGALLWPSQPGSEWSIGQQTLGSGYKDTDPHVPYTGIEYYTSSDTHGMYKLESLIITAGGATPKVKAKTKPKAAGAKRKQDNPEFAAPNKKKKKKKK